MKKKISLVLANCLMLFTVAACSGGGGGSQSGASGTNAADSNKAKTGDNAPQDSGGGSGTGGKKTIVFQMFFPDERFQEAKKKYEALHPDVEIKLEDVQTDDAHLEAEMEKFQTGVSTAILAGKGPDLIQLDDLPVESYVRNGLLVNLETLMSQDASFNKDDYFTNILENAKTGGGIYKMPLSFFLLGLSANKEAIAQSGVQIDDQTWSWNDFAEISKKLVSSAYPNIIYAEPQDMLNWMVSDNASLFMDEAKGEAYFDSASFTGLMQQVKTMSEDGIIGTDGNPFFFPVQINSPGDYFKALDGGGRGLDMKLIVKPHAQDIGVGGYFQVYRGVGISANSKVKEQAWDFIKFMMSDQVSASPIHAGFPINKKLYDQEVAQLKKDGTVPTEKEGPHHGVPVKVNEEELDGLKKYLTGAIHPVPRNTKSTKINEMIREESRAFFSGQKSAEEVAKLIQNKVTTFLNE
ncbi:ABC transporter substrate-binding protein [Paenibacillus macerans]|uniref:ABC transporter substrate-binding protein n=1 Tax=Paenibacillus macerans TaxID=44252 RepID=UPI003D321737